LFLVGKHSREVPEGERPALVLLAERFGVLQFLSFFKARSTLFHHPMVDTRPLVLLANVLRFCRCLLRPKSSPMNGAWSSHARVFFTPWAERDDHVSSLLPYLVAFGGLWCLATARDLPVPTRVEWCFLPTTASVLSVFLNLNTDCI